MCHSQILVQWFSNKASWFCDILVLSVCRQFSELTHGYHNCIVVCSWPRIEDSTRAIRAAVVGFAILLFRDRLIRIEKCPEPWPLTKPRRVRWLCCNTLVFYPCGRTKGDQVKFHCLAEQPFLILSLRQDGCMVREDQADQFFS